MPALRTAPTRLRKPHRRFRAEGCPPRCGVRAARTEPRGGKPGRLRCLGPRWSPRSRPGPRVFQTGERRLARLRRGRHACRAEGPLRRRKTRRAGSPRKLGSGPKPVHPEERRSGRSGGVQAPVRLDRRADHRLPDLDLGARHPPRRRPGSSLGCVPLRKPQGPSRPALRCVSSTCFSISAPSTPGHPFSRAAS